MSKNDKMIESGIEHLKIVPDPNDVKLYFEGGKWYSWAVTIELTDEERDQLIKVLQKMRIVKESGQMAQKGTLRKELKDLNERGVGTGQEIVEPGANINQPKNVASNQTGGEPQKPTGNTGPVKIGIAQLEKEISDRWGEEFRQLNEQIFSARSENDQPNRDIPNQMGGKPQQQTENTGPVRSVNDQPKNDTSNQMSGEPQQQTENTGPVRSESEQSNRNVSNQVSREFHQPIMNAQLVKTGISHVNDNVGRSEAEVKVLQGALKQRKAEKSKLQMEFRELEEEEVAVFDGTKILKQTQSAGKGSV